MDCVVTVAINSERLKNEELQQEEKARKAEILR